MCLFICRSYEVCSFKCMSIFVSRINIISCIFIDVQGCGRGLIVHRDAVLITIVQYPSAITPVVTVRRSQMSSGSGYWFVH
jgi:hypothetical protein